MIDLSSDLLIVLGVQDDRRIPLHPILVFWKAFTQMSQGNDRLFLLPYMKAMKKILPLRTGVKEAGQGDAPRLNRLLLRRNYEIGEFERLIRIALFARGTKQIHGSNCAKRNALKLILRSIDLRKRRARLHSLSRILPILLCHAKAANGQLRIALFQKTSSKRFDGCHAEVPFRIIHRLPAAIVRIADDAIGPVANQLARGAISIAEAR